MRVRLEEIRGARNLEEIADELDVAISTVQRWEKGSMAIPSFRLPAIARAYRCWIKDIFEEEEDDGPGQASSKIASIYDAAPPDERSDLLEMIELYARQRGWKK